MNFEQEITELKNRLSKLENVGNNLQAIAEISIGVMKWINENETQLKELTTDLNPDADPRLVAELITQGKIPPRHIGDKSVEVLTQEIFSLMNTKKMFREESWNERIFSRIVELQTNYPEQFQTVLDKLRNQFSDIERALEAFKTRSPTTKAETSNNNPEPQQSES